MISLFKKFSFFINRTKMLYKTLVSFSKNYFDLNKEHFLLVFNY